MEAVPNREIPSYTVSVPEVFFGGKELRLAHALETSPAS